MREKEIEFKNLLSQNDYEKLYNSLNLDQEQTIINKNYYYDHNDILKNNNMALRIRDFNKKREITLKIKGKYENIEINIPLPLEATIEQYNFENLPEDIQLELKKHNIVPKNFYLLQYIETTRKEKDTYEGLLVLDKTTFRNNIVDYELEFEVTDYEKGKENFEKLLNDFNIPFQPAKPKIARAVSYAKNLER